MTKSTFTDTLDRLTAFANDMGDFLERNEITSAASAVANAETVESPFIAEQRSLMEEQARLLREAAATSREQALAMREVLARLDEAEKRADAEREREEARWRYKMELAEQQRLQAQKDREIAEQDRRRAQRDRELAEERSAADTKTAQLSLAIAALSLVMAIVSCFLPYVWPQP